MHSIVIRHPSSVQMLRMSASPPWGSMEDGSCWWYSCFMRQASSLHEIPPLCGWCLWWEVLRISIRALHLLPSKDPSKKRALLLFLIYIRGPPTSFLIVEREQS